MPKLIYWQRGYIVQQFVTPRALTVLVNVRVPEILEVSPLHEESCWHGFRAEMGSENTKHGLHSDAEEPISWSALQGEPE